MKKHQAKELINKYLQEEATPEERVLIEQYFLKDLGSSDNTPSHDKIVEAEQRITANLMNHVGFKTTRSRTIPLWPSIAVAASVLIFLSFGAYFLLHKNSTAERIAQNRIHDIAPGGNKAVLSLANGKKIILTNAGNGLLAQEGNIAVSKTADGRVDYQARALPQMVGVETLYDTLSVPRGGQYQLKLADGSTVWLNAATSIRFPVSFTGSERKVELIYGEADFQVKHNSAMPFRVLAGGQTIEDVGTNFNINAYGDEPAVKTTLIEGSINVLLPKSASLSAKNGLMLKPGEQLAFQHITNTISIKDVDAEAVVDWKNGEFYFKNESLASIMRRVSRWYDVKVVYEDNQIKPITFSGSLPRFSSLSKVLEKLEGSGDVRFKIDGKRIIVLK
jgi:transmembrane sensor